MIVVFCFSIGAVIKSLGLTKVAMKNSWQRSHMTQFGGDICHAFQNTGLRQISKIFKNVQSIIRNHYLV
jgi:hypothetical protein